MISIHTTRVGGDVMLLFINFSFLISIHTTRVGGDRNGDSCCSSLLIFQSTPPVWVVTHLGFLLVLLQLFQSTPPVWVVTCRCILMFRHLSISIHTTRVGGDDIDNGRIYDRILISIHTTRVGGDPYTFARRIYSNISIHTTRVGGDCNR